MISTSFENALRTYLQSIGEELFDLKAVLFDMDGVLYDSMPIHAEAWTRTLCEKGYNFTEVEAYLHEGRTGSGTINIVYQRELGRDATESEINDIYQRKSELFDASPSAPVMPGSPELLDQVRNNGLQRILVTGSGQQKLLSKLNKHFPGHFTASTMVTAFDVTWGKPHPEPYLMGMKKAGCQPGQAIVVENAPLGVESAKAAGLFVIAVNTGKLENHYLLDAGADLLFPGMSVLNESWNSLFEAFKTAKV